MTTYWKSLPIRAKEEYDAGLIGGEGLQLPHGIDRSESNPDYIYWNHDNSGPWKSMDGGNTWQRCLSKGLSAKNASSIAVDPRDPNRVFALMCHLWYTQDVEFDGLYRSTDGGDNWTLILQKTVGLDWDKHRYIAKNICFDRATIGDPAATTLYTALFYHLDPGDTGRWNPEDGGLWRSTDGGENWSQLVASEIDKYWQITCGGGNVYLATDEGLKIYTGGDSYAAFGDLPGTEVTSVFVHPDNSDIIYATVLHDVGGNGGIYKSIDGGTIFTKLPLDDGAGGYVGECINVYGAFYNHAQPDTIYVTGDSKAASTWVTHDAGGYVVVE